MLWGTIEGKATIIYISTNGSVLFCGCGHGAQVDFKDTTKSSDLSAVQVDAGSTYTAEDTSFDGFAGEVRTCWDAC